MFQTILFKISLYFYFALWSPILTIGLINKKLTRKILLIESSGVLWLARKIAHITYEMHYPLTEENGIPLKPNENKRSDGKVIIASKHMSTLEVAILFSYVKNSFFIIKRELLWIPVYGWAFARIGLIGVNRQSGKTNMNKLAQTVENKIRNGYTLIIFPEGTRVGPTTRPHLKRGLLFLAHELKLPIQPVGVDTGLYWPRRGKMTPGHANIYFEDILPSSATIESISESINKHSA